MSHLLHKSTLITLFAGAVTLPSVAQRARPAGISATQPSAGLCFISAIRPRTHAAGHRPAHGHVAIATAQNLDIQQACQRVAASQDENSVEAERHIAPSLAWESYSDGKNLQSGQLVNAAFNNFLPRNSLNPGKVVYDITASRCWLDVSQGTRNPPPSLKPAAACA